MEGNLGLSPCWEWGDWNTQKKTPKCVTHTAWHLYGQVRIQCFWINSKLHYTHTTHTHTPHTHTHTNTLHTQHTHTHTTHTPHTPHTPHTYHIHTPSPPPDPDHVYGMGAPYLSADESPGLAPSLVLPGWVSPQY